MLVALEWVRDRFNAGKAHSWVGHSVQAVLIQIAFGLAAWPGVLFSDVWIYVWLFGGVFFNAGWWVQREVISDFVERIGDLGLAAALRKFRDDNQMDLAYPMIASWAVVVVQLALFL